jgi:hypothetical protein
VAKTYTAPTTVSAGDAITASLYNTYVGTNVANLIIPPSVSVYRTSNLTGYASGVSIIWQAEHYDTDAMWSSGSGITINTTGLYLVHFMGQLTCSATLTLVVPEILRNTVNIVSGFAAILSGIESRVSLTGVIDCTAGDSIAARASFLGGSNYAWSGGATYGEAQTRLSLTWIGNKA